MSEALATTWTAEGIAFLRRVEAGEVYTGTSGISLARWAVGLSPIPRDRPYDRSDLARCMNVYWSAPESLQAALREQIIVWANRLADEAKGKPGWRWPGPIDFDVKRYYRSGDNLDTYWSAP